MRIVCFLFSQAWFVMPNTSGGGLGVFGRGGRTWMLELSQRCRKTGSVALQRAGGEDRRCGRGREEHRTAVSAGGAGAGSGVSGCNAAHPALGAAARTQAR